MAPQQSNSNAESKGKGKATCESALDAVAKQSLEVVLDYFSKCHRSAADQCEAEPLILLTQPMCMYEKSSIILRKQLEDEQSRSAHLQKQLAIEETATETQQALVKTWQDAIEANGAEFERLKKESKKLHHMQTELGSLRRKLDASQVKRLEGELKEARRELDELRVARKKDDETTTQASSSGTASPRPLLARRNSESTLGGPLSFRPDVAFPDATTATATALFAKQTADLCELLHHVGNLRAQTGGNGWGIVGSTDWLVSQTVRRMLQDIRCLASQGREDN